MSPEATEHGDGHTHPARSPLVASVWDQRYAEHAWPDEPDAVLVELAGPLAPGRALDLGCGPGRNAIWLARRGWEVTGVDASSVGLAQADARAQKAGVTLAFVNADLLVYRPAIGTFDLVVVANIHFDPSEREAFFASAAEALAPRGHLFVIGHHLDSLGRAGPPDPERLYTEAVLADLCPMLDLEHVRRHERPAPLGEDPVVDAVLWASAPARTAGDP